MSDSFVARLARGIGPSDRLQAIAGPARANVAERLRERARDGAPQSTARDGFTRCPHCREYVARRDVCRACGASM